MCKSNPVRRTLPTTSSPYFATGGGYTSSTYNRPRSRNFLNISDPGKYLIILILVGLVAGFLLSFGPLINGIPLLDYFLQSNYLVFQGWVPPLVTSMIVAAPNLLGVEDVVFNAISVLFVDGLLRNAYTPRQYWSIFFMTGILGNVISLFAYGPLGPISFGASGGIFGLVAGAVTADYAMTGHVNRFLVFWFIIIFFWSTFTSANVDIYAHIGGAAAGLIAGYFVGRSKRTSRRYMN